VQNRAEVHGDRAVTAIETAEAQDHAPAITQDDELHHVELETIEDLAQRVVCVLDFNRESSELKRSSNVLSGTGRRTVGVGEEIDVLGRTINEPMGQEPEPSAECEAVRPCRAQRNPGDFGEHRIYAGNRRTQVDMRFAKVLRFGRTKTDVGVDLWNLFNTNYATAYQGTYTTVAGQPLGGTWGQPNAIYAPRFVRLNFTVNF